MRHGYICPHCDQSSTRWWNLKIHMKRKHGGFLLGKSSDQYMTNNPPLYNKSVQLGHATVADTSFQSRYIPQQAPLGTSQYSAGPMYSPRQTIDDQTYGTSLPQSATQKIQEFKALMNKYPKYHNNPDDIIRWAIYNSINDNNSFVPLTV
jgi:Zinc finger, C2H2 type